MATKIVTKNSSTASAVPTASDLVQGELAVNVVDKRLFTENNAGAIVELGTNPSTIDINAGTIDGAVIGGTAPAAITGSTVTSTGNIVVTGTVDGRDVATDGTKLDGIEAGADVTDTTNVTAAGALMDSEVTNLAQVKAFDSADYATAAQGTKVDGIEAGADVTDTANVTAAGALMDSELTSEASVKALNQGVATTDSPTFDEGTFTGILNITPASGYGHIEVGGVDGAFIDLKSPSSDDYDMRMITSGGNGGTIDVGSTGDLSFNAGGSERARLLATGQVGIGTTSPAVQLHVQNSASTSEILRLGSSTVTHDTGIYMRSTGTSKISWGSGGNLAFYGGGAGTTERMRIDAQGLVGIGTTLPSAPLHVQKGSAGSSAFPSGNWAAKIFNQTDASTEHGLVVANRWANNSSTAFEVGGLYDNGDGFDTWMKVTGDGKVGIGTDSPSTYGGALNITDAAVGGESTLVIANNNANQFVRVGINNNVAQIAYDNADSLAFGEATDSTTSGLTTERMRIDSSGNLLVGVPTTSVTSGGFAFLTGSVDYQLIGHASGVGSGNYYIGFGYNGSIIGSIAQSGTTGIAYNTSSDYRLKTDVQPMTGATDRLKALKPVNFEWIADGTRVDGFLAHEAQGVVPECVTGEKDAMQDQEYEVTPAVLDEEGNTVEEAVMGTRSVPDYQGIDQSKLVPLLVATIQELEARITQLENN